MNKSHNKNPNLEKFQKKLKNLSRRRFLVMNLKNKKSQFQKRLLKERLSKKRIALKRKKKNLYLKEKVLLKA